MSPLHKTLNKMKKQTTDWEKIFTVRISDKVCMASIKKSHNSIIRQKSNKKWAAYPNRPFAKENI